MSVIECVANVSEGRRAAVIERFVAAIRRGGDVRVLDYSADRSHHRSVFTFAGAPAPVADAVVSLAAEVIDAIDLRTHDGVHPRIGALDVVPFVPLAATPMSECVAIARHLGERLATQFNLPIFFYEESASRPERRRLEAIRRGGFEGLAAKMAQPEWAPDLGPRTPHPTAGATVVGARRFLIAFNMFLATGRVDIARQIATAIRERDGGMAAVKALGLLVDGRAQVSINLTDFARTPLQQVVDRVRQLADAAGVELSESELIGLIPAAALEGTTADALGLRDFSSDRVVEQRLHILNS